MKDAARRAPGAPVPDPARRWGIPLRLAAAVLAGVLLHFATSLWPHWWAAWLAPIPLLVAAWRADSAWEARLEAWLAALIGSAGMYGYFSYYTTHAWAAVIVAVEVLAWGFVVMQTRRVWRRWRRWPAVWTFPVLCTAIDTLVAVLSPEGNAGSVAFNQARALPVIQIGSILGNAGIVFLVALGAALAAAVVDALLPSRRPRVWQWRALALAALVLAGGLGFGAVRARHNVPDTGIHAGLLALNNDRIAWDAPDFGLTSADDAWRIYELWVPFMGRQGFNLIVLPEEVAPVEAAAVPGALDRLGALARASHAWLEVGVEVRENGYFENRSWVFTPAGMLTADYAKQHLVPIVENDYRPGDRYVVTAVDGVPVGIAICKDLDFDALARRYGQLGIDVLLQPGWDAERDGWWRTQVAILAGVENGYAVIHDSRHGWLTVSDPYGHVYVATPSANPRSPVAAAGAVVPRGLGRPTFYARYGDWFGWLCVFLALICIRLAPPFGPIRSRRSSGAFSAKKDAAFPQAKPHPVSLGDDASSAESNQRLRRPSGPVAVAAPPVAGRGSAHA